MSFFYRTNHFYLFLSFALLTILVSCETDENDIPSYISIDSISLSTEIKQGTASHKITDAWVYVGNKLVGAYEMPVNVPVLAAGSSKVTIYPGVRMNGVAGTRIPYPFYNSITSTIDLVKEQIKSLGTLEVTYNSSTIFAWVEDFENSSFSLDTTQRSNVRASRTNDPLKVFDYSGEASHYSAIVEFTGDSTVFENVSHSSFEVPQDGSAVFLEMNYKTNTPLTIGVYGRTSTQTIQEPIFVLNPNTVWNKIYINLTPTVCNMSSSYDFRIFFSAMKSVDTEKAEILLDNIKLLHF